MNSRKLTTISTLVSGAAAAALLAGTFATSGQGVASASEMATIGGAAVSGIQVQNLSTSAATIQADLFPQGGGAPTTLTASNVVGEGSANFYLPSATTVGAGAYGVVLSSDQQIAAIASTLWTTSGRSGQATYGTVAPAQNVILPLVLGPTAAASGGYNGQISQFSIQNAGASGNATVTVDLYRTGSASVLASKNYTIGAGTSQTVKMGADFTGLPDTQTSPRGFVGYARIRSNSASNPLVVQSFVDFTNSTRAVYAFSGVGENTASQTLYAPLLRRDYFGTTGVSLVNPGGTAANVTINYYADPKSPVQQNPSQTVTVPANSSLLVYQGAAPLPDRDTNIANNNGWFGSAKMQVTNGQSILAVVNDATINTSFAVLADGGYNAATAADGANKIYAPLVRRNQTANRLTTGIQVQNVGTSATNVTVTFKNASGGAAGSQTINNVAPGASVNFYQDEAGSPFPNGNGSNTAGYGSAVVTSSGQPIVMIVNDFSTNATLDSAIYNGLK